LPADFAREVLKLSTDSTSLLVQFRLIHVFMPNKHNLLPGQHLSTSRWTENRHQVQPGTLGLCSTERIKGCFNKYLFKGYLNK